MSSTERNTQGKSTSSQVDFPVSLFPQQENEWENQTTVTSGQKCFELYGKYGHLGSLVRTLLESSRWRANSDVGRMIWKASDSKCRRLTFRLTALDYKRWNGTSGLLQRPLKSDEKGAKRTRTAFAEQRGNFREQIRNEISDGIYPKPDFVEWVKGFPPGWSQINETE